MHPCLAWQLAQSIAKLMVNFVPSSFRLVSTLTPFDTHQIWHRMYPISISCRPLYAIYMRILFSLLWFVHDSMRELYAIAAMQHASVCGRYLFLLLLLLLSVTISVVKLGKQTQVKRLNSVLRHTHNTVIFSLHSPFNGNHTLKTDWLIRACYTDKINIVPFWANAQWTGA